ncbi:MAG: hypothetical protein HKL98_12680 [Burkholderiales bacterium]|nr:hypothetical protein [Burkholderiales bacterium]
MLGDVPEDEEREICELLDANAIPYYQVPASFLGVSPASIWVHEASDYERAKRLLDEYQVERGERARREYEQLKSEGKHVTFFSHLRAHPLRLLFAIAFIAFVLYFSLGPFLNFGR